MQIKKKTLSLKTEVNVRTYSNNKQKKQEEKNIIPYQARPYDPEHCFIVKKYLHLEAKQ